MGSLKYRRHRSLKRKTQHFQGFTEKDYGGPSASLIELLCRPPEILDLLEFPHTPLFRQNNVLQQKYVVEGLSIAQIAKEFLSSKEAVRKGLFNAGVALREQHKPHGRQSQPRYGQHKIKGKVIEYKLEQKIVMAIKQMHAQGLSLREIAKNLSAMGVPTKCNGIKWHPEMVKRIIMANDFDH